MKNKLLIILTIILILCGIYLLRNSRRTESSKHTQTALVEENIFEQWTACEGVIESLNMQVIMSRFKGKTTIIYMAPEGCTVTQGMLLVEFDSANLERDIDKLQHDLRSATADLDSLKNAELPMEMADLANQIAETRYNYESEKQYLEDSHELLADGLISTQEVVQQQHKVLSLETQVNQLQSKQELTQKHLHPARLQQAEDQVAALDFQLQDARDQLDLCRIHSPASGMVTYSPLHISGEYRTVRIGDSVNQNQPFMNIPDMTNLVVQCYIPEADLSLAQPGFTSRITPVPFPDLVLTGKVINVGAMAQRRPGKPRWQKYFIVTVSLDTYDPCLRTGMSAEIRIRSAYEKKAVLIPRQAVYWDADTPYCFVKSVNAKTHRQNLVLGPANNFFAVVRQGVVPGTRVITASEN